MTFDEFVSNMEKCLSQCKIPFEKKICRFFTDFRIHKEDFESCSLAIFSSDNGVLVCFDGETQLDTNTSDVNQISLYDSDRGIVMRLGSDTVVIPRMLN